MAQLRRADHVEARPFIAVKRSRRFRARNDEIDPEQTCCSGQLIGAQCLAQEESSVHCRPRATQLRMARRAPQ